MRIISISEFFPSGKDLRFSGGVEARNFFVAKNLARDHKVTIITSRLPNTKRIEKMYGATIVRVGNTRNYKATASAIIERLKFIKQAVSFGKTVDADLIEGSNFVSHLIAKSIGNHKKIPVVFYYPDIWIGDWIKNSGLIGIFGEILERYNLQREINAYIVTSRHIMEKLAKFSRRKIFLIPCGVDANEFKMDVHKSPNTTIISISRLTKYKKLEDLIFAFATLFQEIKGLRLVIIGAGPEYKNLLNLTKALNISSHVKFLSNLPRKKLVTILKSSHIFCLPSGVEGFGISVIEAAAAGLPYVVTDIDVFRQITKNGRGGLFFSLGNRKDLATKIRSLLLENHLYQIKKQEAIELARGYSWSNIARETEKVYQYVLSKNRQR